MLKAGFARLDITPPTGTVFKKFPHEDIECEIMDPIELNAVALFNGSHSLVWIVADLFGICKDYVKEIKEIVSSRTSVPEEYVILTTVGQYSSVFMEKNMKYPLPDSYVQELLAKFSDVAQMALDDLSSAELCFAEIELPHPISAARRFINYDDTVVIDPPEVVRMGIKDACIQVDNRVRLLRFKRKSEKDIEMISFASRPDLIDQGYISADWPGYLRRRIEANSENTHCLFIPGANGDVTAVYRLRFHGHRNAEKLARYLADFICEHRDSAIPCKSDRIHVVSGTAYSDSNTKHDPVFEECSAFLQALKDGTLGYDPSRRQVFHAHRVVAVRSSPLISLPIGITVLEIGDVKMVGLSGTPYTEYADMIREITGDQACITLSQTNGFCEYFPTEKAFREGGIDVEESSYTDRLQDDIGNALRKLLNN